MFRLFGTKKELFRAVVARCFRETLEMFQRAAEGLRGAAALEAMGKAYVARLQAEPIFLRAQMQAYAACHDPEIREVVRAGFGDLVAYAERVSDLPAEEVARFFAMGMLLNVFASMEQFDEGAEPWARAPARGLREIGDFFPGEVSDESQSTSRATRSSGPSCSPRPQGSWSRSTTSS